MAQYKLVRCTLAPKAPFDPVEAWLYFAGAWWSVQADRYVDAPVSSFNLIGRIANFRRLRWSLGERHENTMLRDIGSRA